jgi:hypothetical protein
MKETSRNIPDIRTIKNKCNKASGGGGGGDDDDDDDDNNNSKKQISAQHISYKQV